MRKTFGRGYIKGDIEIEESATKDNDSVPGIFIEGRENQGQRRRLWTWLSGSCKDSFVVVFFGPSPLKKQTIQEGGRIHGTGSMAEKHCVPRA